jgi:hypothetical protein
MGNITADDGRADRVSPDEDVQAHLFTGDGRGADRLVGADVPELES